MRELVIAGAAAGGKEAAWVAAAMNAAGASCEHWRVLGYVDDNPALEGVELYGHRVLGTPERVAAELAGRRPWFACVIGRNEARERMVGRLLSLGWRGATLVHPSAVVADGFKIGEGAYLAAGVVVSVDVEIGAWVLVNYAASIGHDAVLEDFSQAAPGARINGYCRLRRGAFVGSNAVLIERTEVGAGAKVGAGAAVIVNVAPNTTVVGVPARPVP